MRYVLIVMYMTYGPISALPKSYDTLEKCEEAGKIWDQKYDGNKHVCLPEGKRQ